MLVIVLRVSSAILALPSLWLAALTFMAEPKTVSDYLELYPYWLVPALLLVTAAGLWWTMPMQRLLPIVMALPIALWLLVIGLVIATGWLTS